MRIGTNHGSLSDRIMSRYGDTPVGMVESAMEFLRIARAESYHNIVLSMKSSNPQVMVQAYRLLVKTMFDEFGECYPLHLGVTEAGDGEDGRIKSAVGIGSLLEDGLGDTIRVSLTEDPELEIPVCRDIIKRLPLSPSDRGGTAAAQTPLTQEIFKKNKDIQTSEHLSGDKASLVRGGLVGALPFSPFEYSRRLCFEVDNIGGHKPPVVVADLSKLETISAKDLESIGYTYDESLDKWNISDAAADYVFTGHSILPFALPGTLKVIVYPATWLLAEDKTKYFPIFDGPNFLETYNSDKNISSLANFVMIGTEHLSGSFLEDMFIHLSKKQLSEKVVLCFYSESSNAMQLIRRLFIELENRNIKNPVILIVDSKWKTADEHLIHYATEAGALLLDGFGDGVCFGMSSESYKLQAASYKTGIEERSTVNGQPSTATTSGRTYSNNQSVEQFINNTAFSILQATRTRISKTEYISCPSCGRTLFDLQETTAKIRAVTNHLKGVKIAIMGCIVNGPGEMADADFGYVGSGPGKITLYKGKEVVKRNVPSEVAVEELVNLLKENESWVEQ